MLGSYFEDLYLGCVPSLSAANSAFLSLDYFYVSMINWCVGCG